MPIINTTDASLGNVRNQEAIRNLQWTELAEAGHDAAIVGAERLEEG